MEFQDKVVLITGAGSGFGAACAVIFAARGAIVSLADVNAAWLNNTVDKVGKIGLQKERLLVTVGDLIDENVRIKYVSDTLKAFGKIDILLNIAGIHLRESILEPNVGYLERTFKINVIAPYHLASLCSEHLIKTKGTIINISSTVSGIPCAEAIGYAMSKSAIDSFTMSSSVELGPYGVRVNSIRPGGCYTNIGGSHSGLEVPRSTMDEIKPLHSLGRLAEPTEIAEMIAIMASDKCSFMTGTNLLFDGGYSTIRPKLPLLGPAVVE